MIQLFVASALVIALTAGAGLGAWLLLSRTMGLPVFGLEWLVLVQVHGVMQLFGFAGLFVMGVGLFVLPRFRGAAGATKPVVFAIYLPTVLGLVGRAIAQPLATLPARELVLVASAGALVLGTTLYAIVALRVLRSGRNPHRPDEIVIGIGVCGLPLAAVLAGLGVVGAPLLVDADASSRMEWLMLLGGLATTIFGVWARLAPAFTASLPVRYRPLFAGLALWLAGIAALAFDLAIGSWLLLVGLALVTTALGVFARSIARQPLAGHARITRLAVRSAFVWALIGAATLVAIALGVLTNGYLAVSAARHAFALGFVTLMIYGVASRAVPTFLDRPLGSPRLVVVAIVLTNIAVALRVGLQALGGSDTLTNAMVGISGLVAYIGLVAFAASLARTFRTPAIQRPTAAATPMEVRFEGSRTPR